MDASTKGLINFQQVEKIQWKVWEEKRKKKVHSLLLTPSYWLHKNLASVLVQSLSRVQLFATPWTAAHQAFLSTTNSQSLLKLKSTESVMPSNHLILCHPLLFLPPMFLSIRVFPNGLHFTITELGYSVAIFACLSCLKFYYGKFQLYQKWRGWYMYVSHFKLSEEGTLKGEMGPLCQLAKLWWRMKSS